MFTHIKHIELNNPKTIFTDNFPHKISVLYYMPILIQKFETCPSVVIVMLIYIDRLIESIERKTEKQLKYKTTYLLTPYNSHKIII